MGLHGFLTAIPRGLEAAADIIFFIFIIGGAFGILQRTGVITAAIGPPAATSWATADRC